MFASKMWQSRRLKDERFKTTSTCVKICSKRVEVGPELEKYVISLFNTPKSAIKMKITYLDHKCTAKIWR